MMELSARNESKVPALLMVTGMILLGSGMIFGLVGAMQYVIPGFLADSLPFQKTRPIHVSSVVFWIIVSAMGIVLTYVSQHTGKVMKFSNLMIWGFGVIVVTIIAILISYLTGIFGGREYWEFHPALAIPILASWILFAIVFCSSIQRMTRQPVYVWMWFTGILFFLFTFLESYLWIFPSFRNNIITDMTVQWKSYGSMVGSWNMLIYGSSIFLLDKISGNDKYSHSPIAFILYFTGLFNLMFNWGHHIYTLPTYNYIKYISYAVSMTELFIIGRIIYQWKSSLEAGRKNLYIVAYRFLIAADIWVFLTLGLAILMSVPAINVYTHGTHITVAHTMGATIGINTMLLLAMITDISEISSEQHNKVVRTITKGLVAANSSLLLFWISLIFAGVLKAEWQMSASRIPFSEMMEKLKPIFVVFMLSGVILATGLIAVLVPLSRKIIQNNLYKQLKLRYHEN